MVRATVAEFPRLEGRLIPSPISARVLEVSLQRAFGFRRRGARLALGARAARRTSFLKARCCSMARSTLDFSVPGAFQGRHASARAIRRSTSVIRDGASVDADRRRRVVDFTAAITPD